MHRNGAYAVIMWSMLAPATESVAQDSARVQIVSVGSTNVQVTRQGRIVGTTGRVPLTLASGVHNLRVGDTEHCIYLESGANARLILLSGMPPQLTGARKCDQIWSEIIVESIPSGVDVHPASGDLSKRAGDAVIRVALPDSVRVAITGIGYAQQAATVYVGAMERLTYALRLVAARPTLLPDTVFEAVPPVASPPAPPVVMAPPTNPAPALLNATAQLNLMRSREPAASASAVLSLPTLLAGVTTVVVGSAWLLDTLHKRPNLGKTFGISLGVTAGLVATWWPLNSVATNRAEGAGCGSSRSAWSSCEVRLKADVDRVDAELRSFPARRAQWASDTLKQQQDHQRAVADYPAQKAARDSVARVIDARNQLRVANRRENERRTREWQAQVRASPLVLRSRGKRS